MGTYTAKTRGIASRPRNKRLRETLGAVASATTSQEATTGKLWNKETETIDSVDTDVLTPVVDPMLTILRLTNGTHIVTLSVDSNGYLHIDKTVYSDGAVSAFGANASGGTGGGGGIDEDTLWAILGGSSQNHYVLAQFLTPQLNSIYASITHTHSQYLTAITKAMVEAVLTGTLSSHTHNLSAMINALSTGASTPTDDDYYVAQYVGGGTTTYQRRTMLALWNYINAKIGNVLNLTASNYNGTATYIKYTHSTEINFKNVPISARHWFNYRNGDTDAGDTSNKITDYLFGNRNGTVDGVNLNAEGYKTNTVTNCYAIMTASGIQFHLTAAQNRVVGLSLYNSAGSNYGNMIGAEFDNSALKAIFLNGTYTAHKVRILANGHVIFGNCNNTTTTDRQVRILGDLGMDGNVMPNPTRTYDLGSSTYSWNHVFTRYIDTPNGYDLRICVTGTERLHINATNGRIGVGTESPSEMLHVVGNIYATGAITALSTSSSDRRLKTDIKQFNALSIVTKLKPISFRWNDIAKAESPELNDQTQYGLIAQEAEEVIEDLAFDMPNGYKGVHYEKLTPILLQSVKELKAENDSLKAELSALRAEMNEIKELLKSRL